MTAISYKSISRHLQKLEEKSIYLLREARSRFEKTAILFSGGKDSMVSLYLCQKAFFGQIPFPALYIHHGTDFPETYEFVAKITKDLGLTLMKAEAERKSDEITHTLEGLNKVEALKRVMVQEAFDALIVSIRKDESQVRGREEYFSPRDQDFKWHPSSRPQNISHWRVHPLLDWTEIDVWQYIKAKEIPVNPLYFAKDGKRFRSIGYPEATRAFRSGAKNIDEIIEELKETKIPERTGRAQDKERVMERLRRLGYMSLPFVVLEIVSLIIP